MLGWQVLKVLAGPLQPSKVPLCFSARHTWLCRHAWPCRHARSAGTHGPVILLCSPSTQLLGHLLGSCIAGYQHTQNRGHISLSMATLTNADSLSPVWNFNLTLPRSRIHLLCTVGARCPCPGSGIFLHLQQPTER